MTPTLIWDDKIAFVGLGEDENRFSPEFLDAINAHLDEIEAAGAQGLVTTGRGKFYTNGLDLDWLMAHGGQTQSYVNRVQAMLARVLTLPMPTAATRRQCGPAYTASTTCATAAITSSAGRVARVSATTCPDIAPAASTRAPAIFVPPMSIAATRLETFIRFDGSLRRPGPVGR